ncbi:MAG: alpha-2-macroglobulin family protein [Elusimicrobiota bacterium]|jgi:uncharacterized protein YfaS (alpha-2-macroglobulin family)
MRKPLLAALFAVLAAPAAAAPGGLAQADKLFESGQYQEALKLYDGLSKGEGEAAFKGLYRACESEALLFRWAEAFERLRKAEAPADPLSRLRLRLLRAELGREFLGQYGGTMPEDEVIGETEAFRRPPSEVRAEIVESYRALWMSRKGMAGRTVDEEAYWLDAKGADRGRYPTLLDVYAYRFGTWLLEDEAQEEGSRPDPMPFLKTDFPSDYSPADAPAVQAGALFEEAWRLGGEGRAEAAESWRLERLLIPFRHPDLVGPFRDPSAARAAAAAQLERWLREFRAPEAKGLAGAEAAGLLRELRRNDDALRVCAETAKLAPRSRGADDCARLSAEIRRPELALQTRTAPPPGKGAFRLQTRNLKAVHLRLYRLAPEDLLSRARFEGGDATWSGVLNWLPQDLLVDLVASRKPVRAWSVPVQAPDLHESVATEADASDAGLGLYAAVACSEKSCERGAALIVGAFLNLTDAVLFGSAGLSVPEGELVVRPEGPSERSADAFWLYALDGRDGRALTGAELDVFMRTHDANRSERRSLRTDEAGRASLPMTVRLRPNEHSWANVDPLLKSGEAFAYFQNQVSQGFSPPPFLQLLVETERPVYRPGQKVQFRVVVLQRVPQGFKAYAGPAEARVQLFDGNGVEVAALTKKPGSFGTLAGEFALPTGRMLGNWRLSAVVQEQGTSFSGGAVLSVEEYKRPEFEVTLADPKGPWRFGREVEVEGAAKYYFGGPVPDAPVTYVVSRETWRPWFCWWWSWRFSGSDRSEVLRGQARTDPSGRFRFSFTPQPRSADEKDPMPARFVVRVEARDAGGRTLNAERTYTAGATALLFSIAPESAFATAGRALRVAARLLDLNEKDAAGRGSYSVVRLEKTPAMADPGESWGGFPESPSLEGLYRDVPDGAEVQKGTLRFEGAGEVRLALKALEPGAYRLKLRAEDPWGGEIRQSVVLLCADPRARRQPFKLAGVSLPERSEYAAGETVRMLLGSDALQGALHVEVWGGSSLLSRQVFPEGGVRLVELPLGAAHKGGASVRWFGVKDFKPRAGSLALGVPWKDKRLSVRLRHDEALEPGQSARWSLEAKDANGRPVEAEASVRMFDRSLEYYVKDEGVDPSELYARRGSPGGAQGSVLTRHAVELPIDKGWIKALLDLFGRATREALPPGLRLSGARLEGYRGRFIGGGGGMAKGMMLQEMDSAMGGAPQLAAPAAAPMEGRALHREMSKSKADADAAPSPAPVAARKDFSETAFYKPQLRLAAGKGSFSFKAPERLTSWKAVASVLTRDVKSGRVSATTVTRKELMVRVEMPRFLREGDDAELKAVVHNETEGELVGTVALALEGPEGPAEALFGLKPAELERSFKAAAHGVSAFAWKVKAPRELKDFKVKATARAPGRTDAEERELPVLPSRQRLVDSVVAALDGDATKLLALKVLAEKDPSRRYELLQLQVDPQLALAVLNSIPHLVRYPYECVEQTLDRYVPLAIVNAVYRRHPALAKAAAKVPKRSTLSPAWEKDDAKRVTRLMESPWMAEAEGRRTSLPVIDLLEPSVVAVQRADALDRLKAAQNGDGGFPWFAGGRSDPYITLLVLSGFAEAQRYGVEAPQDVVDRALRYAMSELPRHLKPEEGEVSLLLYASYVVTSFPQKLRALPSSLQAAKMARAWLEFADKHAAAMTQLGKAYAAQAWHRLGEKEKARSLLARAMDGVREDPVAGAYWQPEKQSWLWYHDTLETHAFMLRTLQLLKPKDPRIPGLVQWMLFNRKGTEWKSTKAAAAAVFALLDVLKTRGALDGGDVYSIRWGAVREEVQVGPEDWLETPLRWSRAGDEAAKAGIPEVRKKGPGLAFASLTAVYTTEALSAESEPGMLNVRRTFYRRVREGGRAGRAPLAPSSGVSGGSPEGGKWRLTPLKSGEAVRVGDDIEVQLKIETRSQFEYVHLKDPRGAGFEGEELLSGWKWDGLSRYEEPRDSLTNFFISWLPHGEYILKYRMRPTTPGRYRVGAAQLQSMYAPEFAAHSAGFEIEVVQ